MTAYAPKMTALSPGIVPNVACINSASVPLEVDFDGLVATLQKFAETILFPVWGASAQVFKSERFVPGAWAMVFLDDANDQNTLGYHDLTPDGLPLSKIFVESTLKVAQKEALRPAMSLPRCLSTRPLTLCQPRQLTDRPKHSTRMKSAMRWRRKSSRLTAFPCAISSTHPGLKVSTALGQHNSII